MPIGMNVKANAAMVATLIVKEFLLEDFTDSPNVGLLKRLTYRIR